MALLKEYYDSNLGVKIPNCYWKIELDNGIVGGKNNLRVRLSCYRNRNIADTNVNRICDFNFNFKPNLNSGTNFISQAYNYLKTLPEFKGAVDA